jgi:hypothetical protein
MKPSACFYNHTGLVKMIVQGTVESIGAYN